MYSEHNLPGNPYVPEYLGDTDGPGAQATMAVAYEIRTLTLALLAGQQPMIIDRLWSMQEIYTRLGFEHGQQR